MLLRTSLWVTVLPQIEDGPVLQRIRQIISCFVTISNFKNRTQDNDYASKELFDQSSPPDLRSSTVFNTGMSSSLDHCK